MIILLPGNSFKIYILHVFSNTQISSGPGYSGSTKRSLKLSRTTENHKDEHVQDYV